MQNKTKIPLLVSQMYVISESQNKPSVCSNGRQRNVEEDAQR